MMEWLTLGGAIIFGCRSVFGIVYNADDCISISGFMISFLDNNSFCNKVIFSCKISIWLFSFPRKVFIFFSKPFEIDSILLVKIESSQFTWLLIADSWASSLLICFLKSLFSQFLSFMSFSLAGVVTVKYMHLTSSSREIALSTVMGSWVLMFENAFVFDVVTVLFTIGVVSWGETRSCPG